MIWSHTRREAKHPKVCVNGIFPAALRPAAIPIMFASATPQSKARSG